MTVTAFAAVTIVVTSLVVMMTLITTPIQIQMTMGVAMVIATVAEATQMETAITMVDTASVPATATNPSASFYTTKRNASVWLAKQEWQRSLFKTWFHCFA